MPAIRRSLRSKSSACRKVFGKGTDKELRAFYFKRTDKLKNRALCKGSRFRFKYPEICVTKNCGHTAPTLKRGVQTLTYGSLDERRDERIGCFVLKLSFVAMREKSFSSFFEKNTK